MGFGTLAVVALAGLAGPVLAWRRSWHIPVVIGELVAGILLGRTGWGVLKAADPSFTLLADVGFALVMFIAGSHVPIRDATLRRGLRTGAVRAVLVGVASVVAAVLVNAVFGTGHTGLYAVVMASSSAALVLPIVDSLRLGGSSVLAMLPQVAIADAACIVALPLAIDPTHAARAALGALAVALAAALVYLALRGGSQSGVRHRLHRLSEERGFALELRIQLLILFCLAAVAVSLHVSIMLAGFAFGLAVAAVGEPRRLARQLFGLTEGFLGPLFFIWLGASLDLRDLAAHPSAVVLGLCLAAGAVLSHATMRLFGQPIPVTLLASAQLGVPVAGATLGTQLGLLQPGEAPALLLGALICIGATTAAGTLLATSRDASATVPAGTSTRA